MKYVCIFGILMCFSCTAIAKKMYGVTKPKLQSVGSVKRYLAQQHVDTTRVLFFKGLKEFAQASQHKFLSFPDAFFFDADGRFVPYPKSTENCNANVGSFLSDLRNFASWPADASRNIHDLSSLLTPDTKRNRAAAVTVYITFTTYSGKLNVEKSFAWIELLEKAKRDGISVDYILLSGDYMKNWNMNDAALKRLGVKKP